MKCTHGLLLVGVLAAGVLLGMHARGGVASSAEASPVANRDDLSRLDAGRVSGSGALRPAASTESGFRDLEGLVRVTTPVVAATGAVGIWGECDETVPAEACTFTVEAVKYNKAVLAQVPIIFKAVCVDDVDPDVPSDLIIPCTPLERPSLSLGVDGSIGAGLNADGGIAAGIAAALGAGAAADVGFGIGVPIRRKLRYPAIGAITGFRRWGGNILMDAGLGSIAASKTVVLAHTGFDGTVTFFVSKPAGMTLILGKTGTACLLTKCYDTQGTEVDCPRDPSDPELFPGRFHNALVRACEADKPLSAPAQIQGGANESDFDMQEVIDAFDKQADTIQDIIAELKGRIETRITEVFDTLREFLGQGSAGAASAQQNVLADQITSLLEDRIPEQLQAIRDIVRDLVACPDN